MSQASLEAEQNMGSYPFCAEEFGPVAKFIPDCGRLICLTCYGCLVDDLAKDRRFKCRACGEYHVILESKYPSCNQPPRQVIKAEKAPSPQTTKLQALIKDAQDGLDELQKFDAREHIDQKCEKLELEVSVAAESAVKEIDRVEKDLFRQIKEYRQQCLDALTAEAVSSTQIRDLHAATTISDTKSQFNDKRGQRVQPEVGEILK